ncbi:MAG TPA: hypothetical protein VFV87_17735 [Pirellulaceae bacterium]|nr:hypothetical protein [Pirellulaceae bacterium]
MLVVFFVQGLIAQGAATLLAQKSVAPHENAFQSLNREAAAARKGEQAAIHTVVQEIFDTFSPFDVPVSSPLRSRIERAEKAYRVGAHPPVKAGALVDGINEMVAALGAPGWLRTSSEQVQLFRSGLKPVVPQLVGQKPSGKGMFGISDEMSPAEAAFIGLYLMSAKMWTDGYRVPPEDWVRMMKTERVFLQESGPASMTAPAARATVQRPPKFVSDLESFVSAGLRDGNSPTTARAGQFLDRLGIAR